MPTPNPYRPSNGTEGSHFMESFCFRCKRDAKFQVTQAAEDGCPIVRDTLTYDLDDENYPKEWQHDEDEQPICTAFEAVH